MKVLITGGLGFIGGHLVDRCLKNGWNTTVLDVFPAPSSLKKNIRVYSVDLTNSQEVKDKYFDGIDWVFHTAGRSDLVPAMSAPVAYHHANVTATLNVLEASRKAGVKRFVYAASSTCYGIPRVYPTAETAPIAPAHVYGLTKYMGEAYVLAWAKLYGMGTVSLRLFNVYGPRVRVSEDYGPVLSTFMPQKLAGKPFTVVGDGKQKRDFIYVSDVVGAFIAAAKSDLEGVALNVGTGMPHTVNELVGLLGATHIVHIPKRPGEPDCTWADITKITRMLKWKPRISFEEGIGHVLDNIVHWKDAPVWTPKKIEKATRTWFTYLGGSS